MRNVSGYLTEDGKFFQEKKEAEAHEKLLSIGRYIEEFIRIRYEERKPIAETLRAWETYKAEVMNK